MKALTPFSISEEQSFTEPSTESKAEAHAVTVEMVRISSLKFLWEPL
jgi:hypothetical protein